MTKLIINADDFGYSKGVNLGIIEAYKNGIVTSSTMMTNMPFADDAAALAKVNPGLGVGVHLVLDCGFPVNNNVPSLIDKEGKFRKIDGMSWNAEERDIEKEYTSQIEKFLSFGLVPTHLDSHHHLHGHEKVFPIVEKLANKYNLPIRNVTNHSGATQLNMVQYFDQRFYGDQLTSDVLLKILDKVGSYDSAEIMTHPAYIDEALLSGSSYALQRARELTILTDKKILQNILDKDVELVTYRDIG
ncbi:chitin disaccharide deacetylase [Virgibacillus dakarensis]|uniref:chitin disaccharide deacetylase n=1 Tax=Virgibacillus dakarensis TaxID=1917889 RepID=UPI000B436184|nr:chitin disaccharide deacetylase [Virgibacillus dakarensis]MBT2215978.1 chitin disaccharide deacetylase [Virgibacillus dakarensis]MTW84398.1 chitin disaccharide deacetylase [Virgibacillus dakarensis]